MNMESEFYSELSLVLSLNAEQLFLTKLLYKIGNTFLYDDVWRDDSESAK